MIKRNDIQELFGKVVRQERVSLGLTQSELAEKSNLDNTYISQIERGLANPSIFTLYKIADSLNLTESEVFSRMRTPLITDGEQANNNIDDLEIIYNAVVKLNASVLLTTTHDDEYRIIYCNDAFLGIAESERKQIIGKKLIDILADGTNNDKLMDFLEQLKEDSSKSEFITRSNGNGEQIKLEINASPVFSTTKKVEQHLFILKKKYYDINKTSKAEETVKKYKLLLNETNHRIKNNLSIIIGIIDVSIFEVNDESVKTILQDTQLRISSIAHIHELLVNSEDHTKLGIKDYLDKLTTVISNTYNYKDRIKLSAKIGVEDLGINQVITFGLLSNELMTNSYKHAFPGQKQGVIELEMSYTNTGKIKFRYKDDGVGFDKSYYDQSDSLGFNLIHTFLGELQANNIDVTTKNGFKLSFEVDRVH